MSQQLMLMDAIARCKPEDVEEVIVVAGARVTDLYDHGLLLAMHREPFSPDILEVLLDHGADPNLQIPNIRGACTKPLWCCPNAEAMKILIDHGARVYNPQLITDLILCAYHTALNHGVRNAAEVDTLKRLHYLIKAGAPVPEVPPNALSPSAAFMLEQLRQLYPWVGL